MGDVDASVTSPKSRRLQDGAASSDAIQRSAVDAARWITDGVSRASATARPRTLASVEELAVFGGGRSKLVVRTGCVTSLAVVAVQPPRVTEIFCVQVALTVSSDHIVRFTTVEITCRKTLRTRLNPFAGSRFYNATAVRGALW